MHASAPRSSAVENAPALHMIILFQLMAESRRLPHGRDAQACNCRQAAASLNANICHNTACMEPSLILTGRQRGKTWAEPEPNLVRTWYEPGPVLAPSWAAL